jgi:tyrosinase
MSDVSASPSDPIFWMHHSFIDHNYRIWQNEDASVRTTSIDGTDHNGNPLTLDTPIYLGGLGPDTTIGAIINTMSGVTFGAHTLCYKYSY